MKLKSKNNKLLIFDLDNTLIDRDKAFFQSLLLLLKKYHILYTEEILTEILLQDNHGKTKRSDFCSYLSSQFTQLPQEYTELWQEFTNIPMFIKKSQETQYFLEELQEQATLHLLTNGSCKMQQAKINNASLQHLFDKVVISEQVGIHKPHKDIFYKAIEPFSIGKDTIIMIGDDFIRDIQPALELTIHAIWVNRHKENIYHNSNTPLLTIVDSIFQCKEILQNV